MKKKELLKLGLISTLVIGLFSLLFIEIQRFIMVATQKEEAIPHQLESVQLPSDEMTIPEGFELPTIEIHNPDGIVDEVDITGEESVKLAVLYLWEIFGEEFDTGLAEVTFEPLGPSWQIHLENRGPILYRFNIDANTGELLFFVNFVYQGLIIHHHGLVGSTGPLKEADFLPDEEMEPFYEMAKKFAATRFQTTHVTQVELINDTHFLWDLDLNVVDQVFSFVAFDAIGRQAQLKISREFQTLIELQGEDPTFFSDVNESSIFQFNRGVLLEGDISKSSLFGPLAQGDTIKAAILDLNLYAPHVLTVNNTIDDIQIIFKKEMDSGILVIYQEAENSISHVFIKNESDIYNIYYYSINVGLNEMLDNASFEQAIWSLNPFPSADGTLIEIPSIVFGLIDNPKIEKISFKIIDSDELRTAEIFEGNGFRIWLSEFQEPAFFSVNQLSAYSKDGTLLFHFERSIDRVRIASYTNEGELIVEKTMTDGF